MSLGSRFRGLFIRSSRPSENSYGEELERAADRLADMRGGQVTALPPDSAPSSMDNVLAAAKDYGLSRFSGESDALPMAKGGYRPASKRKKPKK